MNKKINLIILLGMSTLFMHQLSASTEKEDAAISMTMDVPITTQGPLWPPSAFSNSNGDFIVLGNILKELDNGEVVSVPNQAALVSKNTIPPLDENGKEDFTNSLAAPYKVIKYLDLNDGSSDLDMVLYTNSFGPFEGHFGGGPRIPRQGDSQYNLNSFEANGDICPEIFPAQSQRYTYTRPGFALHKAPIIGFLGDDIAYDVDTGEPYTPKLRNGTECLPDGCAGEEPLHERRTDPVTLGEWLKAKVKVSITLKSYSESLKAHTRAKFSVKAKHMLPEAIYQVVFIRSSVLSGKPVRQIPHMPVPAGVLLTDKHGNAEITFDVNNPFPDPELDDAGKRVIGIAVSLKSDYAILGVCPTRFGPGVDVHAIANSLVDGTLDFTDFITKQNIKN